MADEFLTLADLTKINDRNLADIEVTDLLDEAPLLAALAADEASNGSQHQYTKETGAPVVGFRLPNVGRENKASADTLVTILLKILDASCTVDKALAMIYRKGVEAYVAREVRRHLKAGYFEAEKQMINGTGSLGDGFAGLADALVFGGAMVLDATGSTPATASSVYLIRTNAEGADCVAIAGQDGNIIVGETVEQAIEDVTNGGRFTGLYTSVLGWLGLQIGSAYSVARILNLTAQAGKGLTDDLLGEALALFPASRQPGLIVMNRRSREQLRKSRTATNPTGAPAPLPEEAFKVQIITTDAITNTEAIQAEES
ncbi:MAG: hypothetical protein MUP47_05285 [Phycisphaerae bacterium]|nr:hypothetical protein [Phycisphaerae bacterium]